MPFHTNQLGLGKKHWNLETSSAVVEFPPPYPIYTIYSAVVEFPSPYYIYYIYSFVHWEILERTSQSNSGDRLVSGHWTQMNEYKNSQANNAKEQLFSNLFSNARFTLQWFLGEKSPMYRREIGEKSARFTLQWFLGDFSAISRREIAEKLSRPTERHVTSHVIDLDICESLIMDACRWRRLYNIYRVYIAKSLLLLVRCGILW